MRHPMCHRPSRILSRHLLARSALALALAAAAGAGQAAFSPETVGVVHFDLKAAGVNQAMPAFGGVPPGPIVPLVGGPCGAGSVAGFGLFACGFNDNLAAPNNHWVWETEIRNPTAAVRTMNVGFFFPGGPILGVLTLGIGSSFHIGIDLQDGLFLPEAGRSFVWYAWRGSYAIQVDSAVTEKAAAGGTNGAFLFHFHSTPDDAFVLDGSLTPEQLDFSFRDPAREDYALSLAVPEPATVLSFLLGLAAIAGRVRRQRRR